VAGGLLLPLQTPHAVCLLITVLVSHTVFIRISSPSGTHRLMKSKEGEQAAKSGASEESRAGEQGASEGKEVEFEEAF
jgi:hypothetical protein